jgi:hypothetical protein
MTCPKLDTRASEDSKNINNLAEDAVQNRTPNLSGVGFNHVNAFLDSFRFDKDQKMVAEQRKRIGALIKQLQPTASNRTIAKVVGADETTVRRDTAAFAAEHSITANDINAPEAKPAANAAPTQTGSKASKLVDRIGGSTESPKRRTASA